MGKSREPAGQLGDVGEKREPLVRRDASGNVKACWQVSRLQDDSLAMQRVERLRV